MDLDFSCDCGQVTGVIHDVGPREGDRYICYCSDCRDLARHLGAAERVLDANGGTSVYQTRCARMEITGGKGYLACLHMTEKSTLRWYTSCCRTPMFNTFDSGKIPFITTITHACDPERREAVLGPPKGYLYVDEAPGESLNLKSTPFFTLMRRWFARAFWDWLSGDYRRTALFDSETLKPIAEPGQLTENDRKALGRT